MSSICDVAGIRVGHDTDEHGVTGCTVVVCDGGAVGGVDVRGGAPGTRETDLLRPENSVQRVDAILLTGGSAFGLAAASGVARFLESVGAGYRVGSVTVPIVPAAVIFDLLVGDARARPDDEAGWRAASSASPDPPAEGSVGAGTGATVGKLHGPGRATKGGVGTASRRLSDGTTVGAIVVVNAVGNVVDWRTGAVLAGTRRDDGPGFVGHEAYSELGVARSRAMMAANTTIGVVATDARLDKAQCTRLAQVAHNGLALAVRPSHTPFDGDTVFAVATGRAGVDGDLPSLSVVAPMVVAEAIGRAVKAAHSLAGIPSTTHLTVDS